MRLTTIGTGTAAPHPKRVASAHLLEAGEVRLLLDCGSGAVHRMASLGVRWQDITHIALSHFHADHISDLAMLIMAWRWGQLPPREYPVTLYGPAGTGELVERLAQIYGAWILSPGFPLTVRDLAADEVVAMPSGVELCPHPVPHSLNSVAYSISQNDVRLVYTGDTAFSSELGAWALECDLLLAECSLPESMAVREHMTPRQVGELASIAKARQLVLTHFYSPVELVDIAAEVAINYNGPMVLAHDGWCTELGTAG